MAETPHLVDSNVLLRWVKPDHRDYPVIVSATETILRRDGILCYTSQNVGEFWNACTRPVERNGYGLSPQDTDRLAKPLRKASGYFRTISRFMKNGARYWWYTASLVRRSTTHALWRPCGCTALSTF